MIKFVHSLADLTSVRDRDDLEVAVMLSATELLNASRGSLWRLIEHDGGLRLHERGQLADGVVTLIEPPLKAASLQPLVSHRDFSACHDSHAPVAVTNENGGHRHLFPVSNATGIVGFLDMSCAEPLSDDQLRLVSGLLRIYQNHLEMLDYCESDELTGLLNRKTFDASFARLSQIEAPDRPNVAQFDRIERRRAVNPGESRWLAVADIDHFKRINDRFGHICGDDVLIATARLMRNSFRRADRLFRSGGEEFIIILEPTDARFVGRVLDRFRAAVEAHSFPVVGAITISVGYTRVNLEDTGLMAFRRADEALYFAKRHGRNQIAHYEELDLLPRQGIRSGLDAVVSGYPQPRGQSV
jgi:diguanylate cyclase (GGDEF)-like protein